MKAYSWLFVVLLMGAAWAQPAAAQSAADKLVNKMWKLSKWQAGDKEMSLEEITNAGGIFMIMTEDGKISGKSAVNRFTGSYKLEGKNKIEWGENFATNKMAGTPELMKLETQFLKDLKEMTQYSLEGKQLRLSNQGGGTTMTFSAAKGAVTHP